MRYVMALAGALALAGCASTSVKPFSPAPGKQGFVISCGGDLSACYREAQSACPAGFDVTNSSTIHDDDRNRTKSNLVVQCRA